MYANLTKKNVERGKWRFLSEKELRLLKYMNASYKKLPVKTAEKEPEIVVPEAKPAVKKVYPPAAPMDAASKLKKSKTTAANSRVSNRPEKK